MIPRFRAFQAVAGADIAGETLVMLFAIDGMGDIWVKKNALLPSEEWTRVDERNVPS